MRKSSWFVLVLVSLLVAATAFANYPQLLTTSDIGGQPNVSADNSAPMAHVSGRLNSNSNELNEVVWTWDFEGDNSGWVSQPVYWQASDYTPATGSYDWRCFDPIIGPNGGYDDDWLQMMYTPALDLSAATSPELSFQFKLNCEDPAGATGDVDGWDGANVWVIYGADSSSATSEVVSPTTGTDYNCTSLNGFYTWFGPDIAGWGGSFDWSTVTVDLTPYVGNAYVKVVFGFSSDGSYNTVDDNALTGYQIDDVSIMDGDSELFSDGAEDAANSQFTFLGGPAASGGSMPQQINVIGNRDDAPSPTHVLGVDSFTQNYVQTMTSPAFDLPEVSPGGQIMIDWMLKQDFTNDTNADLEQQFYYAMQVWDPEQETWWFADNTRGQGQGNYVLNHNVPDWSQFSTTYTNPVFFMDITPLAGLQGVKLRFKVWSPSNDITAFNECLWDNLVVATTETQHDIQTSLMLPYPISVGLPVPGIVSFKNAGANEETFVGLWGFDGSPTYPMVPPPSYTVAVGETLDVTIDTPNDDYLGWVPTADQANSIVTVSATSSLMTDEVPDNDMASLDVGVMPEGTYELGYNGHDPYWVINFGDGNSNVGPLTHFVPTDNSSYFEGAPYSVQTLTYFWYASSSVVWPTNGADFTIHVYEGGDVPGAELFSETATANWAEGDPQANLATFDVSGVNELQDRTGDFYVWVELTTLAQTTDGTMNLAIPFAIADYSQHFADNNFVYDGTNVYLTGYDYNVTAVVNATLDTKVDPAPASTVPSTFALNAAYPNPFNPSTTLHFDVAKNANVSLKVYNVMGQQVATLLDRPMTAGSYSRVWNAQGMASGVYFVRMQADGFSAVRKVMLMK